MERITVLDTSCIVYLVESALAGVDETNQDAVIDYTFRLMLSNYNTLDNHFVAAIDLKIDRGYWRNQLVKELTGSTYKGARVKKSNRWYQVFDRLLQNFNMMGIPVVGFPSYEADDVAALLVKTCINRSNPVAVDLFTVDTDWMGLISEEHQVRWLNMVSWTPRLRDTLEVVNEWCLRRLKETVNHPSQIWQVKSVQGDKSDNLPPGTPIGLIDLLNPCTGYDLYELIPDVAHNAVDKALKLDFNRFQTTESIMDSIASITSVTSLPLTQFTP